MTEQEKEQKKKTLEHEWRQKKKMLEQELLNASLQGDIETVKRCLISGADVDSVDFLLETALHNACRGAHWDLVSILLNAGAYTHALNARGERPIDCAFSHNNVVPEYVFSRLNGIDDVDFKIENGWTLLHCASRCGCVENIRFLLSKGANVNTVKDDGWTPLLLALVNKNFDAARVLLDAGAELVLPDDALAALEAERALEAEH